MKVFVYVVSASKNPNDVECVVPYEVNNDLIFFGPCKKRLRENFYEKYLKDSPNGEKDVSSEDLYVIGVNGSNQEKDRKIIWAGKVQKVLTFEKAYHSSSSDERFKEMMQRQDSPLHLKPIYDNKETFIGYRLRSSEHEDDNKWVLDVAKKKDDPRIEIKNKSLILKDPSRRKEIFLRDCCFLCDNIFFAKGKGIDIDDEILNILKKAPKNKKDGMDHYAIFGLTANGSAYGFPGWWLDIDGKLAENLVRIVTEKAKKIGHTRKSSKEDTLYRCKC